MAWAVGCNFNRTTRRSIWSCCVWTYPRRTSWSTALLTNDRGIPRTWLMSRAVLHLPWARNKSTSISFCVRPTSRTASRKAVRTLRRTRIITTARFSSMPMSLFPLSIAKAPFPRKTTEKIVSF